MPQPQFTVRARYLFPGDGPPLPGGCLSVAEGRIAAIGQGEVADALDLGQVAILPGLINAHTHLEFSGLQAPLGTPDMAFPAWIRRVIAWRGEQHGLAQNSDGWRRQAIRRGVRESEQAGVTRLGEIATLPVVPIDRYQDFDGVAFLELLGLRDSAQDALLESATQFVANFRSLTSAQAGLSPHAPYTVSPRLLQRVVQLSARERIPVAMHLAETREELELLRDARGPLLEMLRELDAWQADAIPLGSRPQDYLTLLAQADSALVIHGNYLDETEIQWLARHRDRMSVVYCPRTHVYFGHDPYPLAEMLAAGVRVAIGTDSRASNPDLSVLNELRFVARAHPRVSPAAILRMGTIDAAQALQVDDRAGSLTVGKDADFVVVPVEEERADPAELILHSRDPISAAYRAGVRVSGPDVGAG